MATIPTQIGQDVNNKMDQKELDKMKQGYKTAKADTEETMILLEAISKKVKMFLEWETHITMYKYLVVLPQS